MLGERRSLFAYEFVAFFCFWWGLALVGLTYKAANTLVTLSPFLVLGIILLLIGLYSLISRARAIMGEREAQRAAIPP
jgi:steroid 5-alpha reductase family enzyme